MAENDIIINPVLQSATNDINIDLKNNAIQLKKAARSFLNGVRTLINNQSHIRVLLKNMKTGTRSSLHEVYNNMQNNVDITQKCIKLQYKFETALNKFLGRQILLLYVTQDGQMLYANEIDAAKIYRTATTKSGGKGSITNLDTTNTQLKNFPKEIAQDYQNMIERRQRIYRPIQQQVIKRWTDNHNPDNKWVKSDPNLKDTFYWMTGIKNNKKEWDWSGRINRGHIYETYAHLVWEEQNLMILNPTIESDIKFYWDYMVDHGLLNSVAGVVKGDVSFFLNPSIQFAVKSGSFNTAAMGSYLDVAYQLSYGTIEINKTMVETLLNNLASYSYQVRQNGLKKAEQQLRKLMPKQISI